MPGVIVKSSYMTNRTHIVNYLRYIATREGVELLTASVRLRPATARQQTYIAERKEDMDKLSEYQEYIHDGTIDTASRLITAYSEKVVNKATNYKDYARAAREPPGSDPERPVTEKQREFIDKHQEEAEGLPEFEDFQRNQTVGNASALIEMIAEQHPADPEIYLRYIAERPGVEKGNAKDGLFDLRGKADLSAECERILDSKSVVWAHIISLRREDATRLGVDNVEAWRKYLASEAPKIAQLYHISPANLRLMGSFHNEGHHPHVHVLAYSDDPNEGTITKKQMQQAGQKMRSMFTNTIFREDLSPIKAIKTQVRDEMSQRIQNYKNALYGKKVDIDPAIMNAIGSLANSLPTTGNKQYAFFPKEAKSEVDDVLRLIVRKDSTINKLAETYFSCERKMLELYHDDQEAVEAKFAEALNRFYTPRTGKYAAATDRTALHNCIIRWAYAVRSEQHRMKPVNQTATVAQAPPPQRNIPSEKVEPEALPVSPLSIPSRRFGNERTDGEGKSVNAVYRPLLAPKPEALPIIESAPGKGNEETGEKEPEVDASGSDYNADNYNPFSAGNAEPDGNPGQTQSNMQGAEQKSSRGVSTRYLVLLMLRELAGCIETRCNTDNTYTRMQRRRLKGRRRNHQQSQNHEQEAPYEN